VFSFASFYELKEKYCALRLKYQQLQGDHQFNLNELALVKDAFREIQDKINSFQISVD
jgi:hypothetical protein